MLTVLVLGQIKTEDTLQKSCHKHLLLQCQFLASVNHGYGPPVSCRKVGPQRSHQIQHPVSKIRFISQYRRLRAGRLPLPSLCSTILSGGKKFVSVAVVDEHNCVGELSMLWHCIIESLSAAHKQRKLSSVMTFNCKGINSGYFPPASMLSAPQALVHLQTRNHCSHQMGAMPPVDIMGLQPMKNFPCHPPLFKKKPVDGHRRNES